MDTSELVRRDFVGSNCEMTATSLRPVSECVRIYSLHVPDTF